MYIYWTNGSNRTDRIWTHWSYGNPGGTRDRWSNFLHNRNNRIYWNKPNREYRTTVEFNR